MVGIVLIRLYISTNYAFCRVLLMCFELEIQCVNHLPTRVGLPYAGVVAFLDVSPFITTRPRIFREYSAISGPLEKKYFECLVQAPTA